MQSTCNTSQAAFTLLMPHRMVLRSIFLSFSPAICMFHFQGTGHPRLLMSCHRAPRMLKYKERIFRILHFQSIISKMFLRQ